LSGALTTPLNVVCADAVHMPPAPTISESPAQSFAIIPHCQNVAGRPAVIQSSQNGQSDGKIAVLHIMQAIRNRAAERGLEAVLGAARTARLLAG
jgi:hypothetical protein